MDIGTYDEVPKEKAKEYSRDITNPLRHGQKVMLIGKDNPFAGKTGEFVCYEDAKVEETRLTVILESDSCSHYFYGDEVRGLKEV